MERVYGSCSLRAKPRLWVTVIGLVSDMRLNGLEHDPVAHIYVSYLQEGGYPADLVMRTSGEPRHLESSVERIIHSVDHDLVVSNVSSLTSELRSQTAPRRFQTFIFGFFSALAVVLAITNECRTEWRTNCPLRLALGSNLQHERL
jgi:hypothetical protein